MVIGMTLVILVQASQDEIGKFLGQVLSFLSPGLLMELGHCIHLFLTGWVFVAARAFL